MMGTEDNPGVNRRALHELFRLKESMQDIEFEMEMSMLEVSPP